ncbi:FAD-dependent oxidoreductase [Candidatus Fermentibacterales bacterium]|nr:FAD-dependent oxidoreductase [Candidatus Fermentibacterales bacterium]
MIDLRLGVVDAPASRTGGEVELLIAGGGPAAWTAGIYAGRYRLDTLILAGHQPGGQLALTHAIENFPGHSNVSGQLLADEMRKQAESAGARVAEDQVESARAGEEGIVIATTSSEYTARALLIATGAAPRKLGIPGEDAFYGRGVSYCGTCDAPFFRDRRVLVVGGGDTAIKEALYLTEYASEVVVVHRRDELRAEPVLRERLLSNDRITMLWSTTLLEIRGDEDSASGGVTSVLLESVRDGSKTTEPIDGVFVFIGWDPATKPFRGLVELTPDGAVSTTGGVRTSRPDVFAAGDVRDTDLRQVVTAAADGARAAFAAYRLLRE